MLFFNLGTYIQSLQIHLLNKHVSPNEYVMTSITNVTNSGLMRSCWLLTYSEPNIRLIVCVDVFWSNRRVQ
jgi:hypothetical protein